MPKFDWVQPAIEFLSPTFIEFLLFGNGGDPDPPVRRLETGLGEKPMLAADAVPAENFPKTCRKRKRPQRILSRARWPDRNYWP